ncbi:MAG: SMC family ATPase [Methanobrevibacter sp.]|uniref:AAA family ATPase n=1 Tax=Methanobrevibacter sp. TaxID=66852 RepID=UPI0026DF8833|nr:SMC family ATPase [Methanobrevibacter sp.]MDO5849221.1 SMC family ATPase [Methanobrevibacter sp.]
MIFNKLTLKNFKSYEDAKITFNKGITIIVGENGAGKSTILEGISFALFKQHGARKIDDLVRNNSNGNMIVELEFTSNGKEYKIVRDKTKSKLSSTLLRKAIDNGDYITMCAGDKEVSAQLALILAIDTDLFLNAIYVRQGEIAELVEKTPAEKKLLIGKLLGLDSLETAWNNIRPIIAQYDNRKAELKGKLSVSNNLEEEHNKKVGLLNSLKENGLALEEKIKEIKNIQEKNHNDKINMEREKEIYDNFVNNLKSEQDALTILEKDKRVIQERLDEIASSEEKLTRLEKYVKKLPLYLDFEKSVNSIQQLKREEIEISEKIDSIKTQQKIVEDEKEGYANYNSANESLKKLNDKKSLIEKELIGIDKIENEKIELLENIEKSRDELESFFSKSKEQLQNLGVDQDTLADVDNFLELDGVVENFMDYISTKITSINEDIIDKNEEIAKLKEAISSSEKPLTELGDVDNVCPVCQSPIDRRKKMELVDYYQYNIEQSNRLIEEDKETIRLLKSNKENFEEKEKKVKKVSKDLIEYNYKFNDLEKDLRKLKDLDESLETREYTNNKLAKIVLKISQTEKEIEEFKQSYEEYTKAKGALEVLSSETEAQYKLNQIANEIDHHVNNIQSAVEKDGHLSTNITTKELEERIEDLKQKDAEYNQLKGFIQNKKSLEDQLISKKEDMDWKYNKIANIRDNIESSNYDKEKYDKLLYSYELFEKREKEYSSELNTIKGQSKELIAQVNDLKDKILLNNSIRKEYEATDEYLIILNKIRDLYSKNGIQKELRGYSRPLIQKYTKEFFNKFNFNYSDLILDDEYNVTIYGPEGESSLEMVSGGEKIAIALALRLGITQALSEGNLETILLDEPTVHLDASRKQELINLLKEITLLPQMIIVTHEDHLKNAADNLINVEKRNGISEVEIK